MSFARGEGDGIAGFQVVCFAVHSHVGGAFEDNEEFVHVGVRVGGEDFARGTTTRAIWVNGGRSPLRNQTCFFAAGL
jgi:hypothetical protein